MPALIIILLLILSSPSRSSELGLKLGIGPGFEYADFQSLPGLPHCCDNFGNTIGFNYNLNAFYNYHFNDYLYISPKLNFVSSNANLRYFEDEVINVNGEPFNGEIEHLIEYSSDKFTIELFGGWRINNYLSFELGPVYNLNNQLNAYQEERIVEPEDRGVFKEEQTRVRNQADTSYDELNALPGIGGQVVFSFPANFNNTFILKSFLKYNAYFGNNLQNVDWITNNLTVGVGFSYVFDKDIYKKKLKLPDPVILVFPFELVENRERTLKNLNAEYIIAEDINTNEKLKLYRAVNKSIIFYISVDNLYEREGIFQISNSKKVIYKSRINERSEKVEIDVSQLKEGYTGTELNYQVAIQDTLEGEFVKEGSFGISEREVDKLSIFRTNDVNKLINNIKANQNKKLDLYSDDEALFEKLQKLEISNLTVKSKDSFPYISLQELTEDYILLIE